MTRNITQTLSFEKRQIAWYSLNTCARVHWQCRTENEGSNARGGKWRTKKHYGRPRSVLHSK